LLQPLCLSCCTPFPSITIQALKWDFNFGGHQLQKSCGQPQILVAKVEKIGSQRQGKQVKTNILSMILQVEYFPLSDGKLSRISSRRPQLCWPPD
jgi:hypothetical protein